MGLELADEQVLVFGDPRGGTLLMQADAAVGIELPLKLLVWDANGVTQVGYHDPTALAEHYALEGSAPVLERMRELLGALVAEATTA